MGAALTVSSPIFCPEKEDEVLFHGEEKVGEKSKTVIKAYVNQNV